MPYLWDDFKNIRTFPAIVRAYRDGAPIDNGQWAMDNGQLPTHIIHAGKLTGIHNWNYPLSVVHCPLFLTARIESFGDTTINITASDDFDGLLFIKNTGKLHLNIIGENTNSNIKCKVKLFAAAGSENELAAVAIIPPNARGCESDISFAALCDPAVRSLRLSPVQRISSVPKSAGHSASIFHPAPAQIKYLETAGLDQSAAEALLNAAFMEEAL